MYTSLKQPLVRVRLDRWFVFEISPLFLLFDTLLSIITSLYTTTIDSTVQFHLKNTEHATEDGEYIQDRGYILGQRKGAVRSLPVYCAIALAVSKINRLLHHFSTLEGFRKAMGVAHDQTVVVTGGGSGLGKGMSPRRLAHVIVIIRGRITPQYATKHTIHIEP